MKVCDRCGDEIFTKDGDNTCSGCEDQPGKKAKRSKGLSARSKRAIMESLGLERVVGAMGGVYYE